MENLYSFNFSSFPTEAPGPVPDSDDHCQEITKDGKKYHHCAFPECGKTFRFKSEFVRHSVIHTVQRPFNCPHPGCSKTFKREDALKNHVRIHTGELPYQCEFQGCGLSFPTKAGLRYHLLKHKNERQFVCGHAGCNKSFLTMAQLKQHENASNFHKRVSQKIYEEKDMLPVAEEESITKKVCKDKEMDEFFVVSPVQPVAEPQWEVRTQFDETKEVSPDMQNNFEKMLKVILKENSMNKQRINMCNTLMNLMQENNNLKMKLKMTMGQEEPPVASISDADIFSVLNFSGSEGNFQHY